jgi:hypothetical protein
MYGTFAPIWLWNNLYLNNLTDCVKPINDLTNFNYCSKKDENYNNKTNCSINIIMEEIAINEIFYCKIYFF